MSHLVKSYTGILLCGGKGTRLAAINSHNLPKSLFKVADKELIRYSVDILPPALVKQIIFAVDYKAEAMKSWVETAKMPYGIQFSEQTSPGVLEAIIAASHKVQTDSLIVCNTDEIRTGFDLGTVLRFHESQGKLATMVTTYGNGLSRHRVVQMDTNGNVIGSQLKPQQYKSNPEEMGLVNTGFLVIDKEAMAHRDITRGQDWGGLIDPLTDAGQLCAFVHPGLRYFNVGTPQEYYEAEQFLKYLPE